VYLCSLWREWDVALLWEGAVCGTSTRAQRRKICEKEIAHTAHHDTEKRNEKHHMEWTQVGEQSTESGVGWWLVHAGCRLGLPHCCLFCLAQLT
jgi:hypothetical protein